MSQTKKKRKSSFIPVPFIVNLLEIDTVFENASPSDEEDHVAETPPELVD